MPSFYCPELDNIVKIVRLSGEEHHHLAHVLRNKEGDIIFLNSGKGFFGKGEIISIGKNDTQVEILETHFTPKPQPAFSLAFSLLRNKNDEWIVEKATELGAEEFFPMRTQYSVRTASLNTVKRFQATALSAIKQCDNPWLPFIHPVLPLQKAVAAIRQAGYEPVFASENLPNNWMDSLKLDRNYCFFVGPEGGFSPEEFEWLSRQHFTAIRLSSRILRAETAAVALAAQFNLLRKQ